MGAYYIYHNCMNFLLNEKFYSFFYMLSSHTDSSLVCAINKRWVPWYCYYMYASSLAKCLRSAPLLYMYQQQRRGADRRPQASEDGCYVFYVALEYSFEIHSIFYSMHIFCHKNVQYQVWSFFFGGGGYLQLQTKTFKASGDVLNIFL